MRFLAVLVLCGTASAEGLPMIDDIPPAIRVTPGDWYAKIERVALAIHAAPETSWLTISSHTRDPSRIELDVPEGTRVIGLGVANDKAHAWGRPTPSDGAPSLLAEGAAMVRWEGESAGQQHLVIVIERSSTVEVALQLPPLARLAVEADAGATSVSVGDELQFSAKGWNQSTVVELDDIAGRVGTAMSPAVEDGVAIVAAETPKTSFLPDDDRRVHVQRDIDKAIIRRVMKQHRPQLRECFQHYVQFNWALEGSEGKTIGGVIVAFTIVPDGSVVESHTVESDLPQQVNQCLVDEVIKWQFPETDGRIQVNYPLEFQLW
jgi:hypothetical protein